MALACPALLAALPALGETGRAFTLEDLYRVKSVGEPAISPDGKTVVYSVGTNDWPSKKRTVALWRVGLDGKDARPITSGEARDEHPFFSPDGKTLAFLSTRAGDPQLFFLPLAGGEAEQKTRFPGGIADASFSRDGRFVLFTAAPTPRATRKPSTRARRTRSRRTSPTRSSTGTGRSGRTGSGRTSFSSTSASRTPPRRSAT